MFKFTHEQEVGNGRPISYWPAFRGAIDEGCTVAQAMEYARDADREFQEAQARAGGAILVRGVGMPLY